ncbi:sensor histidine kinase [Massilia endophytica]|uniref:sensor histidine kinase n=1 Tax=Massilia endophytica TaxID=2899220 RepID=UPI001E537DDF|nr:sensor histidine kinase [Massilia endophytica]UGQ45876.1 sensor histidine kinase [Massilia endophytica]
MDTNRRLPDFISANIEPILLAWDDFARTIEPPALTMNDADLRDHARLMLGAFADDIRTAQSDEERIAKSKGLARRSHQDTPAEIHAQQRLRSGYTVVQLISEYRALRASVLMLWSAQAQGRNASMDLADITRFNEAVDQAVAESVARYERLVKQSQNMFLAILGHDLRNPLGTLIMGSTFIMQGLDLLPKYVLVATRMFNSAKRMDKLVNDLVDFTRTHLGRGIPISPRTENLGAVCEQVVNELRTFHPDRVLELNAPPSLSSFFDASRIAQVLSNLIGNALQYGSSDAPVRIDVAGNDDDVFLAVNNHGPVIPPEKTASIFDPLVRLSGARDSAPRDRMSLGIGLFIAREIVHAHGGSVEVQSNITDGTTFTVTLPRKQKTGLRSTDP